MSTHEWQVELVQVLEKLRAYERKGGVSAGGAVERREAPAPPASAG